MIESEENTSFEELLAKSEKNTTIGKTVTGRIIQITSKQEIFVDIGYKADGIIPKQEYSFNEQDDPRKDYKVGDEITADVLKMNDGTGNVLLSCKRAKQREQLVDFEEKVKSGHVFSEPVKEVGEKGLIVQKSGIRIFIPFSLSLIRKDENAQNYKGKIVEFKVTECDLKQRRVIGSIRAIAEEKKEALVKDFWENVEDGKCYNGTVTSISTYGAFVDVGGVQGLLHISEMTWGKNVVPSEILQVGQNIQVTVKHADKENKRLMLVYNEKGPNPWEKVDTKYKIGDILKVKIVKLMPFGAFAELEKGIEGLIHISQISDKRITKPEEELQVGQHVNCKIISVDLENKKIELSIRELLGTENEYKEEI